MTYVISDLHGYPLEKFKELLKKAAFSDNDFLYISGDVIDIDTGAGSDNEPVLLRLDDFSKFRL